MKERRSFLHKMILSIFGLSFFGFKKPQSTELLEGNFVHMVFFWLKEPEKKSAKDKFELELNSFINNTPVIHKKHIGTPASTRRPVVDSTYTYSLVLTFNSRQDYDIYADHPLHLTFVEKASHLWEKVQVYDSTILNS